MGQFDSDEVYNVDLQPGHIVYVVKNFDSTREIERDTVRSSQNPPLISTARYGLLYRGQWFPSLQGAKDFLKDKYTKELQKNIARQEKLLAMLKELV